MILLCYHTFPLPNAYLPQLYLVFHYSTCWVYVRQLYQRFQLPMNILIVKLLISAQNNLINSDMPPCKAKPWSQV